MTDNCDCNCDIPEAVEELAEAIDIKTDGEVAEADMEDIWIAGYPIGKIIQKVDDLSWKNKRRLDDLESDEGASLSPQNRTNLLPLHRMVVDLNTETNNLRDNEERAAHLFRRFIRQAAGEPGQNVDASGQAYTMNTKQAEDTLHEEDLLDGISQASYSQIVGRAMRAVQAYTKTQECDCETIDLCDHGLVEFRAGKPHSLHVKKRQFHAAMEHAEESIQAPQSAPSADDATSGTVAEASQDSPSKNLVQTDGGSDNVVRTSESAVSDSDQPNS